MHGYKKLCEGGLIVGWLESEKTGKPLTHGLEAVHKVGIAMVCIQRTLCWQWVKYRSS